MPSSPHFAPPQIIVLREGTLPKVKPKVAEFNFQTVFTWYSVSVILTEILGYAHIREVCDNCLTMELLHAIEQTGACHLFQKL